MNSDILLIKNGTIVDGTGRPGFRGDVLIRWGKIIDIGHFPQAETDFVIDGEGKVVCPGFIDTHVHSDLHLLEYPDNEPALAQGVTTEVLGQDGLSYAPLSAAALKMYRQYLAGLNGNPRLSFEWSSVREFRNLFEQTVSTNTVFQAPHGAIRLESVGFDDVPLQGPALKRAQSLLAEAFEQGAAAFSTGLSYYPCSFADTAELVALCRVAAAFERPFVIHLRTVFAGDPFDPVEEAISIAQQSGAPLHFSHFRTRPDNAGRLDEVMAPIDRAAAAGVDVSLECYPYATGAGFLMFMMPRWAHRGGYTHLLARLADPAVRRRIEADMKSSGLTHDGILSHVSCDDDQSLIGRKLSDIAAEQNQSMEALVCDLMLRNSLEVGFMQPPLEPEINGQIERDIMQLIQRCDYMVGSDRIAVGRHTHPRSYGCFPKFLRLRREHNFMSLEGLIQHLTENPARRFGLTDRGVLKPGRAADVVVFDPETIRERASYEQPHQLAEGVAQVVVNGKLVFAHGRALHVTAGRALP